MGTAPKGVQALACKEPVLLEAFANSSREDLYLPAKYSCPLLEIQRVQENWGAQGTEGHPPRNLHPKSQGTTPFLREACAQSRLDQAVSSAFSELLLFSQLRSMLCLLLAAGDGALSKWCQGGPLTFTLCSKLLINILDPIIFSLQCISVTQQQAPNSRV